MAKKTSSRLKFERIVYCSVEVLSFYFCENIQHCKRNSTRYKTSDKVAKCPTYCLLVEWL